MAGCPTPAADAPRPRRPSFLSPAAFDAISGGYDPAREAEAAHSTAAAIVDAGRGAGDPELTARLVTLVDDQGLSTLADLWADRPARSLPGALWRLYVLREGVRRDPVGHARDYAEGQDSRPRCTRRRWRRGSDWAATGFGARGRDPHGCLRRATWPSPWSGRRPSAGSPRPAGPAGPPTSSRPTSSPPPP